MANEFKIKKGLIVEGASGGTVVNVLGSQGQLLSVTDDLSGSIFAVSDISGVPILDVNSSGVSYFDGSLGIGTANPSRQLEVVSSSGIVTVLTSTTGGSYISMEDSATTSDSQVRFGAIGNNAIIKSGGTTALSLDASQNATFAGDIAMVQTSGNNTLTIDSSGGGNPVVYFKDPTRTWGQFVANGDLYLKNETTNVVTLLLSGSNATFAGKATSLATAASDGSTTLTTKSYVDGLVTGVPVYKGTWDARTQAEGGLAGDGGNINLRLAANKVLGNYYIVETAGSATPNGANTEPSSWNVGDWCIFSDITSGAGTDLWQRIDNSSVISGAGTGQKVTKWEGATNAVSETLTDGPITFSTSNNDSTFAGDVQAPGIYVGATNTSFDFYNNGTSYLNGAVTVDAAFTQSGGGASTFSGDVTLTNGQLTVTHDTNNVAKIIQSATSMSNATYTFEVDSSSHNSNMSSAGAMAVDVNSGRAFTIDGKGDIGIGTNAPATLLHVKGGADDNEALLYVENTHSAGGTQYPSAMFTNTNGNHSFGTVAEFRIQNGSGADRPSILFTNGITTNNWSVGQGVYSANDNFAIGFRTGHPGVVSAWADPKLVILTSGNVGIGITNPTNGKLVIDSTANQIAIETGTAGDGRLNIGHFSNGTFIGTYGDDGGVADNLRFGTHSGDTRMTISSAGAIQFNNYNSTNNTGTPTYLLGTDASGNVVKTLSSTAPGSLWAASGNNIYNTNSANVGIGLSGPETDLMIYDTVSEDPAEPGYATTGMFALNRSGQATLSVGVNSSNVYWMSNVNRAFTGPNYYNISLNPLGGKVGIGTTSPDAKLDVHSSINISNPTSTINEVANLNLRTYSSNWGYRQTKISSTLLNTTTGNNRLDFTIADGSITGGNIVAMSILSAGGNVGIGVIDPQAKLEVKGISATPGDGNEIISVTNTLGGSKLLLGVVENSYGWIQSAEGSTYRNLLLNPLGGNVGIATSTPTNYKLEVNGNVKGNSFGTDENTTARIFAPSGAAYNGSGTQTGYLIMQLPDNGAGGLNNMMSGVIRVFDYTFGESFDVHFAGYWYSGYNWTNCTAFVINEPGVERNFPVRFGAFTGSAGANTRPYIAIGDTASTWNYCKFSVTEYTSGHSNMNLYKWNSGWAASLSATLPGAALITVTNTQTNNWKRSNNDMYSGNSGNVGIGTTSPDTKLHIVGPDGPVNPPNYSVFDVTIENVGQSDLGIIGTTYSGIYFGDAATPLAGAVVYQHSDDSLTLRTGGNAHRVTVSGSGAVKFNSYNSTNNTGTPTYLLGTDASGNIVKTNTVPGSGAGPYLPVANPTFTGALTGPYADLEYIKLTAANPGILMKETDTTDKNWDIQVNGGNLKFYEVNDARSVFSEKVTFEAGGNVGIGVTNPGQPLEVAGNIKNTTYINTGGQAGAMLLGRGNAMSGSYLANDFLMFNTGGDCLILGTGGAGMIVKATTGNVGIGTSTPNAKLDIQGTQGQLFSVTDDLSGSIFAVSDISGVPIFDVNSSGLVTVDGPFAQTGGSNSNFSGNVILTTANADTILTIGTSASGGIDWDIQSASSSSPYAQSAGDLLFRNASSNVLILGNNGSATFAGNVKALGQSLFLSTSSVFNKIALNGTDMEIWSGALFPSIDITSAGLLKFGAYALSGAGTPTKLLGVDNSGNVLTTVSGGDLPGGPYLPLSAGSTVPLTGDLYLDDDSGATPSLYFKNGANNFWRYLMESGGDFSIKEGTSTRLTFQAGGNVGIGTTSPQQKLHINGNVRVGTDTGFIDFARPGGAIVGGIGWHTDNYFYVAGHPTAGTGAGNNVRVYAFGALLSLGNPTVGDALTVAVNGNVGIGTTSPSAKLSVIGDINFGGGNNNGIIEVSGSGDLIFKYKGSDPALTLDGGAVKTIVHNRLDALNIVNINNPSNNESILNIQDDGTNGHIAFENSSEITGIIASDTEVINFRVGDGVSMSDSPVLTLLPSRIGINTTSPNSNVALDIDGRVLIKDSTGVGDLYLGNYATANHFRFHTNNANTYFDMNCGDIYWRDGASTRYTFFPSTANMTINGTLTQNSDARVKENIVEISDCISKVQAMKGVYYNRTDFNTEATKVGVIAQDVEAVLPELIIESPEDGLKSVAYSELTAVLINAIKEQQEIIEDLKTRITKLEN
mgnify:CR=1 FL=1